MKRVVSLALVTGMVATLLALAVGAAGAQEAGASGQVAVINGASTDPVTVAAGATTIATDLVYGVDAQATLLSEGAYVVSFTGGSIDSTVPVNVAAGTAQTVVSGYGDDPATAKAYAVDVAPIDTGMAKLTVWNATGAAVLVTVGAEPPIEVAPGTGIPTVLLPAGTNPTIDIDGIQRTVETPEDSYTDVFAVNDTSEPKIAVAVIPSMTELIAALAPPPPEETVPVPDVAGQPAAEAQATLEAAGFVVTSEEQSSEGLEAGLVIETNPAAGTEVPVGSAVTMIVSSGPDEPATIPVPDVTGQTAADAQAELEAAGFVVESKEQSSDEVEAGLVIETNPVAGTEVAPGTTVTMTVSTGPEDVTVPDFTGMTVDEATAAAEDAGLTITFVEDPDDPDPEGLVVDQDPAAGETAPAGSEVTALLSPAVDDAWTILMVDQNRLLTVGGINFMPGSTTESSIVATSVSVTAGVDDDGFWKAEIDMAGFADQQYLLEVTGTAADGSDYQNTFKVPAAGESTDEAAAADDSGIPAWGWVIVLLAFIMAILLGWLLISKMVGSGDDADGTEGA